MEERQVRRGAGHDRRSTWPPWICRRSARSGRGSTRLKDGLTAAVSKLLSGELLTGLKNFSGKAIENALGKLGAINVTKLIELDVDLPKKLTFSVDEIGALKLAIDTKGIDAVENALRGIIDSDTLDKLKKLMDEGDGLDRLRGCVENSFAAGTAVLLADGTRKPIEEIAARGSASSPPTR